MRKPMVTRSFETVVYKCICMDMNTMLAIEEEIELPKIDDKKLDKVLHERLDTDGYKFVAVKEATTHTKLLGMDEALFIKYAIELDPNTRKEL